MLGVDRRARAKLGGAPGTRSAHICAETDWLSHIFAGLAHVRAGTRIVQIVRKSSLDWTGLAGVWLVGVRLVPVHLR
jgi:hypothetical protein